VCFVIDFKSEGVVDIRITGHILEKDAGISGVYGFKCDSISSIRFDSLS